MLLRRAFLRRGTLLGSTRTRSLQLADLTPVSDNGLPIFYVDGYCIFFSNNNKRYLIKYN